MGTMYVSMNTIRRLPRYLRLMEDMLRQGARWTSSAEMARRLDTHPSQVRQDLAQFGTFGHQGCGYNVEQLRQALVDILGVSRQYKVILIGAGHLGKAILENFAFIFRGYELLCAYDIDPAVIGTEIGGYAVRNGEELPSGLPGQAVDIAILTVPRSEARKAARAAAEAGVRALWNFTGVELDAGKDVLVEDIRFSDSLLVLSYQLNERDRAGERETEDRDRQN